MRLRSWDRRFSEDENFLNLAFAVSHNTYRFNRGMKCGLYGAAKHIPSKGDCAKVIRDVYAERYLEQLGIDSKHKEEVEEEETSVETEGRVSQSRVGFTGYIKPLLDFKLPYQVPTEKEPSTKRELPFLGGGATAWLPTNDTDVELTHQLERQRMQVWIRSVSKARQPISVSSEEIRKECTKLTKGQLPLELLTRRPKPQILRALRVRILCADQVRLTKMEALVISVQEETPVGVGFAVPALLLATKMLVEEIFKKQYPDVFRPAPSQQHLWEEPGCKLWRKLQASLETKQSSVARAQAKACRTSALLLRALSGGSGCADSRTRRFLAKGASERGELVEPGTKENSKEEALRRAQHERWRSRALLRQASVARPASAEEILAGGSQHRARLAERPRRHHLFVRPAKKAPLIAGSLV
eukprot:g28683.t1